MPSVKILGCIVSDLTEPFGAATSARKIKNSLLKQVQNLSWTTMSASDLKYTSDNLPPNTVMLVNWDTFKAADAIKEFNSSEETATEVQEPQEDNHLSAAFDALKSKMVLASVFGEFVSPRWILSEIFGLSDDEIGELEKQANPEVSVVHTTEPEPVFTKPVDRENDQCFTRQQDEENIAEIEADIKAQAKKDRKKITDKARRDRLRDEKLGTSQVVTKQEKPSFQPIIFGYYNIIECEDAGINNMTDHREATLTLMHSERKGTEPVKINMDLDTGKLTTRDIDFTGLNKNTHSLFISGVAETIKIRLGLNG